MPDLQDGESVEMKGSAKTPYVLKNTGGVYSCRDFLRSCGCEGNKKGRAVWGDRRRGP